MIDRFAVAKNPVASKRPCLSLKNAEEYLDWIMANILHLSEKAVEQHLRAAELVIRMQGNEAQAKATLHTLVEDGTIAPGDGA